MLKTFVSEDHKNPLISTYKISFRIAQQDEAHTIAENLIKPCAKDLVESMIGKNYVGNIEAVLLSNSTVSRRISDMAEYCQKEVIKRVKQSPTFFFKWMNLQTLRIQLYYSYLSVTSIILKLKRT